MEIEKKYKIKQLPFVLSDYPVKEITQGYLCENPILRIRKSNEEYMLTYKSNYGISKKDSETACVANEVEVPLEKAAYEHLVEKIDGYLIQKKRYLIPLSEGLTAELDVFEGRMKGLMFVEVEFADLDAAKHFQKPEWFGEDVTQNQQYRNKYIATLECWKE